MATGAFCPGPHSMDAPNVSDITFIRAFIIQTVCITDLYINNHFDVRFDVDYILLIYYTVRQMLSERWYVLP